MVCSFRVLQDEDLLLARFAAMITVDDVLKMVDGIDSDPMYRDGMSELYDMRAITSVAISPQEIYELGQLVKGLYMRRQSPCRTAIWAPTEVSFENASLYASGFANSEHRFGVYETLEECLEFLGVRASGALRSFLTERQPEE